MPGLAVVTGGGGGIGAACARRLAAGGRSVALIGRGAEALQRVADELGERGLALPGDVRDGERMAAIADELRERFGAVDAVVASAGGQFAAAAAELSPGGWRAVVETNLTGTFLTCRTLLPLLRERGGAVVSIVANVWQRAAPAMAHSGAARAGVVSLTRTLALEWAPLGVRVNAVSPGLTDTPALRAQLDDDLDAAAASVPLGRMASPEEIAGVVDFLLGPEAAYVTGEVLVVDGGLQLA